MFKKLLVMSAAVSALFAFTSCNKDIEYNSNTGGDGSRDTASQLLINTPKTSDISAPEGDNEDWYYFAPQENGFAKVILVIDNPRDVVINYSVMDNFGRPLQVMTTNGTTNLYEISEFPVQKEHYFVALKTTEGKSTYTIKAEFRLPDPEPDCEIGTYACAGSVLQECTKNGLVEVMTCEGSSPVCDADAGECRAKKSSGRSHAKCVPANKCKAGQNCCKPTGDEEGIGEGEKTVRGTIVLVTPRSGDLADVKINGLGQKKGVKKGAKAYLRGLKRKVDIYDCKTTYCMATIKATSEELTHYDTVDVVVE